MDTITMKELKTFLIRHAGWHVSLFMPTHRAGRETEQDPIRFRNLLREVEEVEKLNRIQFASGICFERWRNACWPRVCAPRTCGKC
jgi:hypothetical protein